MAMVENDEEGSSPSGSESAIQSSGNDQAPDIKPVKKKSTRRDQSKHENSDSDDGFARRPPLHLEGSIDMASGFPEVGMPMPPT